MCQGAATSTEVRDLMPGVNYRLRICAENEIGKGPWSSVAMCFQKAVGEKKALRSGPPAPAPPVKLVLEKANRFVYFPLLPPSTLSLPHRLPRSPPPLPFHCYLLTQRSGQPWSTGHQCELHGRRHHVTTRPRHLGPRHRGAGLHSRMAR